jgi:hypothetical protein
MKFNVSGEEGELRFLSGNDEYHCNLLLKVVVSIGFSSINFDKNSKKFSCDRQTFEWLKSYFESKGKLEKEDSEGKDEN